MARMVEPASPKLRALLVDLVVHHGQVVSRDRLIEDLWAGSPPSTGLGVLQNYVSQLRKTLGTNVVVTRGPGYVLMSILLASTASASKGWWRRAERRPGR